MIKERLPVQLEPTKFAKQRRRIQGDVAYEQMPRVSELLALGAEREQVKAAMSFDVDDHGFVVIHLIIEASLPLVCQRTLDIFYFPVKLNTNLSPVYHDSEAKKLPAHYEPLMMDEDMIRPSKIVEDELLLALPIVPKKPLEADEVVMTSYGDETQQQERQENPFKVLQDLKLDTDD